MNNDRDKKQLEIWMNIYHFMSASFQIESDFIYIDKDKESAEKERKDREKWLLDNWQIIRPNLKTRNRRVNLNIFNISK